MGKSITNCNKGGGTRDIFDKDALEDSRRTSRRQNPKDIMNHYQKQSEMGDQNGMDNFSSIAKNSEYSYDGNANLKRDGTDLGDRSDV